MPSAPRTLPLAIGAIVVVGVAAVLAFTSSGNDENDSAATAADPVATTAAAPVAGVTYEIAGSAPAPLDVTYTGPDGDDASMTVSELPWSITVDPAPAFVRIVARSTSVDTEAAITLTLKRGAEVLRTCHDAPCLTEFPT